MYGSYVMCDLIEKSMLCLLNVMTELNLSTAMTRIYAVLIYLQNKENDLKMMKN